MMREEIDDFYDLFIFLNANFHKLTVNYSYMFASKNIFFHLILTKKSVYQEAYSSIICKV